MTTSEPRLPAGFTASPHLTGIKVTVTCSAPGCTADSQCADCRWIATGQPPEPAPPAGSCFLCGGTARCRAGCPNRDDEWN